MLFHILTLFPEMVGCFFRESIVKRSIDRGLIEVDIIDIRNHSRDKHRKVDDYPFGGGRGMLLAPDPLFRALESIDDRGCVIYLSPRGKLLTQSFVREYARRPVMTLVSGHYEGIDQRVIDTYVDEEISIGDYVMTGGEIAAAVFVDALIREIDDALGSRESKLEESFDETGLLEYEQYTRPAEYRGMRVPEILLSGDHKRIEQWRLKRRLINTMKRRPDLLDMRRLPDSYKYLLQEIEEEKDNERGE
jgi:tRNA (guanine37-N1)-methyltransferase